MYIVNTMVFMNQNWNQNKYTNITLIYVEIQYKI